MTLVNDLSFNLDIYKALPHDILEPSNYIDFLHLLYCDKPAIRIKVENVEEIKSLHDWCNKYNFELMSDRELYVFIGKNKTLLQRIMKVDQSIEPHEELLGRLLGYPDCCCRKIAEISEENIDDFALEIETWLFEDEFKILDPKGYLAGTSLICHLPCSPTCQASMVIAEKFLQFALPFKHDQLLTPWKIWWEK